MKTRIRMLIALAVGLIAIVPAGASAQDDAVAAYFEVNQQSSGEPDQSTTMVGDREVTTARWENVAFDAGDARASGIVTLENNETGLEVTDGSMNIVRSAVRIVNDDGAWAGTGSMVMYQQQGPPSQLAWTLVLDGEDAYDGLILEIHGEEPDEFMNQPLWGVIYPADAVPPTPESIE